MQAATSLALHDEHNVDMDAAGHCTKRGLEHPRLKENRSSKKVGRLRTTQETTVKTGMQQGHSKASHTNTPFCMYKIENFSI
jgi:hypothetical protein